MPDRHRLSRALATLVSMVGWDFNTPRLVFVEVLPRVDGSRRELVYDSMTSPSPPIGEVVPGDWGRLVPGIRKPRVGVTYDCRLVGGAAARIAMRPVSPAEVIAARRAGRW